MKANSIKETEQAKSKSVLEIGSSQSWQIGLISHIGIQHPHLFYQVYSHKNLLTDPAKQDISLPLDCSTPESATFTDPPAKCS